MTSFPSQRFSFVDRGILRDGMKADVAVFDPATVDGPATYSSPRQPPIGIKYVLVNGKIVFENGCHSGLLPGEALTVKRMITR